MVMRMALLHTQNRSASQYRRLQGLIGDGGWGRVALTKTYKTYDNTLHYEGTTDSPCAALSKPQCLPLTGSMP